MSLAQLKKCMHPHPVYHATLDDGRTVRMSVWQRSDAPDKGFDWEACRRTVLAIEDQTAPLRFWRNGYHYDGDMRDHVEVSALERPLLRETGRKIIAAHLEQAGDVLADDPLIATAPKKAKKPNLEKWYAAAVPLFHKAMRICETAGELDLAARFRAVCNGTVDAYNGAD